MRNFISAYIEELKAFRFARRQRPDTALLAVVLALTAFGLLMNYSTTFDWSATDYGGNPLVLFGNQLAFTVVGLGFLVGLLALDYAYLSRVAVPAMLIVLAVLLFVRAAGDSLFGATRTLAEGSIQPSELAKIITILYVAMWLSSRQDQLRSVRFGLIPFAIIVGTVFALVAIQPDLSTATVIAMSGLAMFFLAGAQVRQMLVIMAVGVGVFLLSVRVFSHAAARFDLYLDSLSNLPGLDTHLGQVRAAIIDGGLFGQGIGAGYRKFGILPLPFSDSIYPAIAEEWGIVGVVFTLGLFAAFLMLGLRVAYRSDSRFGAYVAIGITTWITVQMLVNVMGMLGLVPPMGVPVPFLSKGGSSALSVLAACGILLSVSRGSAVKAELLSETSASGGRQQARANTAFGRRDRGTRLARADRAARAQQADDDEPAPLIGRDAARPATRSRQRFASQRGLLDIDFRRGSGRGRDGAVRRRGTRFGAGPGDPRRR